MFLPDTETDTYEDSHRRQKEVQCFCIVNAKALH